MLLGNDFAVVLFLLVRSKRDKGYVAALTVFMTEDGTLERDVSGLAMWHCEAVPNNQWMRHV